MTFCKAIHMLSDMGKSEGESPLSLHVVFGVVAERLHDLLMPVEGRMAILGTGRIVRMSSILLFS